MDSTVKEGKFQGEEKGQAKTFPGEVGEARAVEWTLQLSRRICRVLVLFQVWPNLKWERRLGDEGPAHEMTGRNE